MPERLAEVDAHGACEGGDENADAGAGRAGVAAQRQHDEALVFRHDVDGTNDEQHHENQQQDRKNGTGFK